MSRADLTGPRAPASSRYDPANVAGWAVTGASLLYVLAGLWWMTGRPGYPYGGDNDPTAAHQILPYGLTQEQGAPWVLGLGLAGATIGLLTTRVRPRSVGAAMLIGAASVQAVAYALLVPDGRLLVAAAHVPVLIIGKPFGWPPGVTIASQLPWPVLHQAFLTAYGMLWAAVAILARRRATAACQRCGRTTTPSRWTDPVRNRRYAGWAVGIAVTVPTIYATTRLAWALGIPLGVSRTFLTDQSAESPTIFTAGALLALLALFGGGLTLGLVMRWGETYPRWIPRLGGRPIQPRLATLPATVVALLLTGAGLGWIRAAVSGRFPDGALDRDWATTAPGMLLPLWGVALAVATYAYHLRRRGSCNSCGRE